MKIELEINDLERFVSGLNNALVVFGDICSSITIGCEPGILTKNKIAFEAVGEEKLNARYKELLNVYLQLLELEEKVKE